jgi:DNA-binding SARP family transcriptional activator
VKYRLLGPIEMVTSDGRPITVRGSKVQGLLVLLALNAGHAVSRERLIDALYDGRPRGVDNALQQLVSKIRRMLADDGASDRLATRSPGYCLVEPASAVDALLFEHLLRGSRRAAGQGSTAEAAQLLRDGLGLWRGDAFAAATLLGDASAVRTRVEELRLAAAEDLVDYELQLGHHVDLVAELTAMVTAAPLRERRWAQLMVALYRCGRQSDALRAYQDARSTLIEELGVEPGPELSRLHAAVLAHDQSLAVPSVPAGVGGESQVGLTGRAGKLRLPRTSCVGRGNELDRLNELTERPGLTTLIGPGGVGKTRLALEVAARLQQRLPGGVSWSSSRRGCSKDSPAGSAGRARRGPRREQRRSGGGTCSGLRRRGAGARRRGTVRRAR